MTQNLKGCLKQILPSFVPCLTLVLKNVDDVIEPEDPISVLIIGEDLVRCGQAMYMLTCRIVADL